ncbi:DNA-directed RNA polymerase alpha subunit [Comamonas sp. BIGb0152]|uniref:DNA-directed RNA polymerase subunit alpha C-terminal domain-containing protein n=1 Tax=Comamonas sp. BIGb0152 TaxID=2940601 RepID=UPI0021672039|nr:DNA-directed RNA polymerase subunit alpha C-terminal domain-containing protein [Comamonas sp. BIGb0152]MCS4293064.1 DNA-directed RNA polymerase alpha subunit [Comamonas sp. BIGb0152]
MATELLLNKRLSRRTLNSLGRHAITTVDQVVEAYPERLLKLNGVGMTVLRDIERTLFPGQQFQPDSGRYKAWSEESPGYAQTDQARPKK